MHNLHESLTRSPNSIHECKDCQAWSVCYVAFVCEIYAVKRLYNSYLNAHQRATYWLMLLYISYPILGDYDIIIVFVCYERKGIIYPIVTQNDQHSVLSGDRFCSCTAVRE